MCTIGARLSDSLVIIQSMTSRITPETDTEAVLLHAAQGFKHVSVSDAFKEAALTQLREWLTDPSCAAYRGQIHHVINEGHWDYLLDSFYQVIPFGTGGRRGEVGIGPNRINPVTIRLSAQGHAQYLLKEYGEEAKTRGVVMAFDVRVFHGNAHLSDAIENPLRLLDGPALAKAAIEVYAANGIKCFLFDGPRSTPELSFAVRHLNAIAGDVFSASHNPPDHNGKKLYDRFGGQLIPPQDEALVQEVVERVQEVVSMPYEEAKQQGLVEIIGSTIDDAYTDAVVALSASQKRDVRVVCSPLHGTALVSVVPVLKKAGFDIELDPGTSTMSGKFENVTFNIPNPEVVQSFEAVLPFARQAQADVVLSADPDADRLGALVRHEGEFRFMNGNEIGVLLAQYIVQKRLPELRQQKKSGVIVKTAVTTDMIQSLCDHHGVECVGDLLVGFKYVGDVMNQLERDGRLDEFLLGTEESHGYLGGAYARDKDASIAALWLCEYAAQLKADEKTLVDALHEAYATYGYYKNYLTEIRLPGAEGRSQIDALQASLRAELPNTISTQSSGVFRLERSEDYLDRTPIVSSTDEASKNVLVFYFTASNDDRIAHIKVTVRPSGTEPKIKMYFELGSTAFESEQLPAVQEHVETVLRRVEKAFMTECYKRIGYDFPERGFALFWQMPLQDKMKYFEVEPHIAMLKDVQDAAQRRAQLESLLSFMGADPIAKMNDAFTQHYGVGVEEYLEL